MSINLSSIKSEIQNFNIPGNPLKENTKLKQQIKKDLFSILETFEQKEVLGNLSPSDKTSLDKIKAKISKISKSKTGQKFNDIITKIESNIQRVLDEDKKTLPVSAEGDAYGFVPGMKKQEGYGLNTHMTNNGYWNLPAIDPSQGKSQGNLGAVDSSHYVPIPKGSNPYGFLKPLDQLKRELKDLRELPKDEQNKKEIKEEITKLEMMIKEREKGKEG